MPQKVETYQSNDGKLFAIEADAVKHEALVALFEMVPDLKDRINVVEKHVGNMADALYELAVYRRSEKMLAKHSSLLDGPADDNEDPGGCDCAAAMAGNGPPHHPTCPMHREALSVVVPVVTQKDIAAEMAAYDRYNRRSFLPGQPVCRAKVVG